VIKTLESRVTEKDAEIERLQKLLQEKERQLREKDRQLSAKDAELSDLRDLLENPFRIAPNR
jgi:predicted  nucleic acid-binding Zn-ribbon protein